MLLTYLRGVIGMGGKEEGTWLGCLHLQCSRRARVGPSVVASLPLLNSPLLACVCQPSERASELNKIMYMYFCEESMPLQLLFCKGVSVSIVKYIFMYMVYKGVDAFSTSEFSAGTLQLCTSHTAPKRGCATLLAY